MLSFPAPSADIIALPMVDFCKAWRKEASLSVGDLEVRPSLKTCVSYYRALKVGMPSLPMVLSIDVDGEKSYTFRLADGRTDELLTHCAAERVGLCSVEGR